jgi:hypothetical protein
VCSVCAVNDCDHSTTFAYFCIVWIMDLIAVVDSAVCAVISCGESCLDIEIMCMMFSAFSLPFHCNNQGIDVYFLVTFAF